MEKSTGKAMRAWNKPSATNICKHSTGSGSKGRKSANDANTHQLAVIGSGKNVLCELKSAPDWMSLTMLNVI